MDLQFPCDVAPMRDDGVDRDEEVVGNFLVGHSLNEADDDFFLTLAEGFLSVVALAYQ